MIDKCFLKMFPHTSFYSSFCSYLMAMKLSSVIFELVPQKSVANFNNFIFPVKRLQCNNNLLSCTVQGMNSTLYL
jgi:hypothetical protein